MKTKLFTLLLAIAAGIGSMFASETQVDGIWYDFNSSTKTASVTYRGASSSSYSNEYSGDIVIPKSVTYNSTTYSVTSIGDWAFYMCSGLTSVTIGNSVTSIGDYAFSGCTGLTSVTIPNSVTSIGWYAFSGCTGLTSVTIPNSVTSIGWSAFSGCTGLTSVTIPNSVTSIGENAFNAVPNIVYSGRATGSPWGALSVNGYVDGYLVYSNQSKNTLRACFRSAQGEIVIPNSVTSIGDWAFYMCSGLTSVTIGNSVTSIGDYAFYECSGLTSVTIGNSVTSIGRMAFYGCTGLTSVTIPNSVTSIGEWAFDACSGLTSVTIPNSVTSIGEGAFRSCSGLTSVTIPNSVTSIGEGAFRSCSGLTSVTIPNSVTSIGEGAFRSCSGLTSVTIPNSVTSIGKQAFENCSGLTSVNITDIAAWCNIAFSGSSSNPLYYAKHLYVNDVEVTDLVIPNNVTSIGKDAFYNCSGLTSVTIPNSVTSIGEQAFRNCRGLTGELIIPNSVTSIGSQAFSNCTGLTSVTIEAETPPTLGSSAFYGINYNYTFYVPCGTLDTYKTAWSDYASRIKYAPLPYKISTQAENGSISITSMENYTICDEQPYYYTLTVVPNYGYHFAQWSDGNTDNPRTIVLTQDTTFTAEFAKNTYTITTQSNNPEWGTTARDTAALYLEEVEISAIPNYGYHFVRWNDYNTSNPRTVSVTEDKTYTATFAKNVYPITTNAEHGSISGNSSAEYLDYVTLTVTPDYGYHFVQWSDGLKDNPRVFQITKDTAFTAEFAYDRVGTCGKDLALVWSYDPNAKVLTIGNAGSFTENMQYGVEAPNEMEELVIGNSVTAIGANAFAGIETLKKVSIGESVKTIGEQAFYNCVNLETIFNYRPTPTNTYSNAFDGVDKFECTLYVLPNSIDMYKAAAVWRDFYYTYAIGAEETTVTTNDVTVEPQDNAATVTWPTNDNAASYTIQITKDGVVFCTLIFNANGQLIGIAFAPSRDGQAHAPAALMTANGLQFTVTGLDSNTQYGYNLTAKDANDQTVATYSGSFTTTSEGIATGVEDVQGNNVQCTKVVRNGQIFILRGEKIYSVTGQEVK